MIKFLSNLISKPIVKIAPITCGYLEYVWGYKILRRLKVFPCNEDIDLYAYSKEAFARFGVLKNQRHLETPFGLMAAIPDVNLNSLLCIGPRFTAELCVAESFGFKREGIKAIDLFTFSDRIDVGDMHHMPYASNSFSNVMAARLLAYSKNPSEAAAEFTRVLKVGGYLYVSGDSTYNLKDYDAFFPNCIRVFGIENISHYKSKYADLVKNSDCKCTIAIYKKLP